MCGKHRTGNRGLVALIIVAVGLLAGCSGNNADPAGRLDPATLGQSATDYAPSVGAPATGMPTALPVDEYIDPAEIRARRGSVIELLSIAGDDFYAACANSVTDAGSGSITLAPSPEEPAWVIYQFTGLLPEDIGLVAKVYLKSPADGDIHFGISNYGTGRWDWYGAASPTTSPLVPIDAGSQAANAGGNLYLVVASGGTAGIGITEVTLRLDVLAPAPEGLTAGYDELPAQIDLTWNNVTDFIPDFTYESVRIERHDGSGDWTQIAEVPEGVSEYSDIPGPENELVYGREYSYRVRTVVSGSAGDPGETAVGRRMVPDVTGFAASDGYHPGAILLTWTRVSGCDGYVIEINHGGEWQQLRVLYSDNYYRDWHIWNEIPSLELQFNRDYKYRIRAVWEDQASTNDSTDTGRRALGPVEQLVASDGSYPDKVVVGWQELPNADGYELEYRLGSSGDFQQLATLTGYASRTFEHTHLAPAGLECAYDTVYEYRVRGTYEGETMPWEEAPVDGGFRRVQPPAMVLAADGESPDDIEVTWSAPVGINQYKVYRDGVDPGNLVASVSDETTWTDPVTDYATHDYYLVSSWQGIDSVPSEPDNGFRALFQSMTISTSSHYFISLAEVDGRPAIAASRQSEPGLHFYQADVAQPGSADQWQSHNAFEDCSSGAIVSLSVFDGRPAVAVGQMSDYDNSIHFVRAATASPVAVNDWTSHEIAPVASSYNIIDMATVNGVPALTYYYYEQSWINSQRYVRATVTEPGSATDWATCDVPNHIYFPNLVECHGRPVLLGNANPYFQNEKTVVMYGLTGEPLTTGDWQPIDLGDAQPYVGAAMVADQLAMTRQSESAGVNYSRALTDHPTTAGDWESHRIDDCIRANGFDSLVDIGGRPVLVYVKPIGNEYGLMVAAGRTAQPGDAADWDIYRVTTMVNGFRASLLEVDGHVALAWIEQQGSWEYHLRFAISNVPLPGAP